MLERVVWAALPGKAPDTYLLEDVRLAIVPAPRLIGLSEPSPAMDLRYELLAVGGIDYNAPSAGQVAAPKPEYPDFVPLAGAEAEVLFASDLYERVMRLPAKSERVITLRGAEATEERFREVAPQSHFIHLATHSFNLDGMSGLAMAGINVRDRTMIDGAGSDNGRLRADEVASLPLGNVRLAVLSTGEPQKGRIVLGEGRLGLQRAFQVAGVRSIIAYNGFASLDDQVARRFTEQFYHNFLENELAPIDAVREAQLWLLRHPKAARPVAVEAPADYATDHMPPKCWGGFTLYGRWD